MASSVKALAEAFEGTLRKLRRLRRHLKGASKPSSTDLQIQFLKLPPYEGPLTDCLHYCDSGVLETSVQVRLAELSTCSVCIRVVSRRSWFAG